MALHHFEVTMRINAMTSVLTVASVSLLFAGFDGLATSPAEVPAAGASTGSHLRPRSPIEVTVPLSAENFQVRATLEPYFIDQAPDFMIRSRTRADMVIQRIASQPSPPDFQGWHTHPGPSFGIVDQGRVEITRVTSDGCVTSVYAKGQAYYEVANEVHRAKVVGPDSAIEYKVRFNTPVGMPFTTPHTGAVRCEATKLRREQH